MPKATAIAAENPPCKPPPAEKGSEESLQECLTVDPQCFRQRRREQNRVSQQTFREKKDQRIKELESQLQEAERRCELLGRDFAALLREHMKMKAAARRNVAESLDVAVANGASVGQAARSMQDTHHAQFQAIPEEPQNPNQYGCSAFDCMEWIEQSTVDS